MIALGSNPVNPRLPSTTTIIGAIARIGIVCDAMIHGISERSSTVTWTIPIASSTPMASPRAKPATVADSVTCAW